MCTNVSTLPCNHGSCNHAELPARADSARCLSGRTASVTLESTLEKTSRPNAEVEAFAFHGGVAWSDRCWGGQPHGRRNRAGPDRKENRHARNAPRWHPRREGSVRQESRRIRPRQRRHARWTWPQGRCRRSAFLVLILRPLNHV